MYLCATLSISRSSALSLSKGIPPLPIFAPFSVLPFLFKAGCKSTSKNPFGVAATLTPLQYSAILAFVMAKKTAHQSPVIRRRDCPASRIPCHAAPPSTHPPIHPSTHPPIHQSTNPSIHQSINPPIHQSTNPPIHPSTNPPIHQSTNPPIHQSTHPSIHPSINPPIHHVSRPLPEKLSPYNTKYNHRNFMDSTPKGKVGPRPQNIHE